MRKYLSINGLLASVRKSFSKIDRDGEAKSTRTINLQDCLMSGLAIFGLKFPSLLKFDKNKEEPKIRSCDCSS